MNRVDTFFFCSVYNEEIPHKSPALKCYKNVLKYVIGLDLLNCNAKFRGDTISRSRENGV